jgi:hypothetical protein
MAICTAAITAATPDPSIVKPRVMGSHAMGFVILMSGGRSSCSVTPMMSWPVVPEFGTMRPDSAPPAPVPQPAAASDVAGAEIRIVGLGGRRRRRPQAESCSQQHRLEQRRCTERREMLDCGFLFETIAGHDR